MGGSHFNDQGRIQKFFEGGGLLKFFCITGKFGGVLGLFRKNPLAN